MTKFNVVRTGSSIGEIHHHKATGRWDAKHRGVIVKQFQQKEEAHAYARRMRSFLSPGEKSYYGASYITVAVPAAS